MLKLARLVLLLLILAGFLCPPAKAQDSGIVERVRTLYQDLRYDEGEERALQAIDQADVYDVNELAELHAILALIHYVEQNEDRARQEFLTALALKPDLELDPILVPPRAITFFDELRAEVLRDGPLLDHQSRRYILLSDPRPGAAMRSALVPGWGQYYKGHRTKGWVVGGLFIGSVTAAIIANASVADTGDTNGTDGGGSTLFRDAMIVTSAGIWLYGYLDALLDDTPLRYSVSPRIELHATPTIGGVQFGGVVRF